MTDAPRYYVGTLTGYAIPATADAHTSGNKQPGITACVQDRFHLGREIETFRSEDTRRGHAVTVALAERQCERLNEWDEGGCVGPPPTVARALREVRERRSSFHRNDRSAAALEARAGLRAAALVARERGASHVAIAEAAGVSVHAIESWAVRWAARTG